MISIVIPYRYANEGIELKYALRSICKHLTGFKDVYLIGDGFPKWYKGKKIDCPEESQKTSRNIINKLLKATQYREIGDPFLRWDDDIYLTRDIHVSEIQYWYDGDLERAIKRHHGSYKTHIVNTAFKVTDQEKYYDIHAPMIFNKYGLQQIAKLTWDKLLVKTMYCHHAAVVGTPMKDCKISGPHPIEEIKERIAGNLFFSTSHQSIGPEMIKVLDDLFPEPSKYE